LPTCDVIDDAAELPRLADAWDGLAVRTSAPYASPHLLIPWWHHVAPPKARLQVVAVRDDAETLIGLGPWYLHHGRGGDRRLRSLGAELFQQVGPLAEPGREGEVAHALAAAVSHGCARAPVLGLEGLTDTPAWAELLTREGRWHVSPWRTDQVLTVSLAGRTFDDWFMSRSKHFRQRMRKLRRDFEDDGGTFRLADAGSLDPDVKAFLALHRARWEDRGGSSALRPGVEAMLRDAGRALLPSARLRLWTLELDGEPVSSHVLVGAGETESYWLTGFDEARRSGGSNLGILHAIEDSFGTDAAVLDLGPGAMAYKQRFADHEEPLSWQWLVPPGPGAALTRARLIPQRARIAASASLPPKIKESLRRLAAGRGRSRSAGLPD